MSLKQLTPIKINTINQFQNQGIADTIEKQGMGKAE